MREVEGDIWNFHKKGHWIVIPTNGTVKKDGSAVMGRGVALQAKQRNPNHPFELGRRIRRYGLHVYPMSYRAIAFPVKYKWQENASLDLIQRSCIELVYFMDCETLMDVTPPIYMVRPGCGNGRLNWKDVKPFLEKYLDDRFIVVERRSEETDKMV